MPCPWTVFASVILSSVTLFNTISCLSRPLISVCQPHPQLAINMIFFVLQDGLKIQTFLQAYTCFFGLFQYSSPWFHLCFGGLIIGTFDAPFLLLICSSFFHFPQLTTQFHYHLCVLSFTLILQLLNAPVMLIFLKHTIR